MKRDDLARERQAEPQSAAAARGRAVTLGEAIEDVRQQLRRDPLPRIDDVQLHTRLRLAQAHARCVRRAT